MIYLELLDNVSNSAFLWLLDELPYTLNTFKKHTILCKYVSSFNKVMAGLESSRDYLFIFPTIFL